MAPKKAAGKDKGPVSDVASLYAKREPLAPQDPPNVEEIEDAWKVARDAFLCPLPEWDSERVDQTEWNPNEAELYLNDAFSVKLLPRHFMHHISAWKRAHSVSDNTAGEEPAPEAKPPAPPPEKVEEIDPKAKGKAKAAPDKGKDKGGAAGAKPTTTQQFAELQYTGESMVVSPGEFRNRMFDLSNDDSMPPLSQAIAAQIAIVGEHGRILPQGHFLWELIYPQNEDHMPLFNPNGKYIVKLHVQGKWREVMVDDVVPVGSATGSSSLHAPILPATSGSSAIWPMILAKALIRAYQHDLRVPIIPAVPALTGMSLLQLPMSYAALRSVYDSRPFCCLQLSSKVDLEARQREALLMASPDVEKKQQQKPGGKPALGVPALPTLNLGGQGVVGPQGPKLGANPLDAVLQFLVCELEEEPPQVRMKAGSWRPQGGTPRKVVLDVAESEGPDEEEDLPRQDDQDRQSDNDDEEHDGDEEDRRSQRSPSGEATQPSARSKEEPGAEGEGEGEGDGEAAKPPGAVWPSSYASALMPKSESMEYHDALLGGYWVGLDALEELCDSFIVYLPPGTSSASAHLDTTWKLENRAEAYTPAPLSLLRLRLTPADLDIELESTPRDGDDFNTPRERGPPWHKATFLYEPLRLDPGLTPAPPIVGPGSNSACCMLQQVNHWNPLSEAAEGAPEFVNMSVAETGGSSASRGALLPSGESWYLVHDDAKVAGSVLSAHVDGAMLSRSKSSMEFVDPTEFLPGLGVPMVKVGACEYPAQSGFSVWAKAEVNITSPEARSTIQLLSYVSDAALRSNLRLSLLKLEQENCEDASQQCAAWSVSVLTRVPLQPLMSLPLNKPDTSPNAPRAGGDVTVKYILVLEANVPTVAKAGTFALHVMMPPLEGRKPGSSRPATRDSKKEGEEDQGPLQLIDLKVDQVTRWNGDVVENEKGCVLRERIVVPHGSGDVTAAIRITVTGLPKVVLNASLLAQLQPTQEMRPRSDGATPEPFQPGGLVDPKEYGGRQNWLASKRVVAVESGTERVMFLHVLLCEGSTYLLEVFVDPHKGPDKLEGGQWTLEMFGSSAEVELGADTMEQDLEGLVRQSWEMTAPDAPPPPRNERAAVTRKRWLRKRGLLENDDGEDLEEESAAAPKAEAKAEAKAKAKPGKGEVAAEPEVDKEQQEAEWLAAALERAGVQQHSNITVDEFVLVHTDIEPTLIEEDPYTIAPVLDDMFDAENPDGVAIQGLGMRGSADVRQKELENTVTKWEKIQEEVTEAITRNKQALIDLTKWSEETAGAEPKFKELRETMRNGLQLRYAANQALKDLVGDAERLEPADLQSALEEAERQEVSVWDAELVETGGQKKTLIEDFNALRDRLSKLEAEPLADEESRVALSKLSDSVGQLQRQLKKKKLPLPPEMFEKELLQQASDAIAAAAALAEQGGDEGAEAGS